MFYNTREELSCYLSAGEAAAADISVDIAALAAATEKVAEQPNISGIAVGIIRNGKLVHTVYAGEAAPDVPVTAEHWFNTASVAKTLMAETVLPLATRGALKLDDPIGEHYRHPHLTHDPRYDMLTPRLIMSHQTSLKNWPDNYEDNRLAFLGQPGDGKISYSAAAIEILMRCLEARFDKTYPELVETELFQPLGITGISFCPDRFGYGLGWAIFEHDGQRVLNHGGNDFAEHAQVYYDPTSGDAMVLFMTGGNAFGLGLEVIAAVDPDLPIYRYHSALIALMQTRQGG